MADETALAQKQLCSSGAQFSVKYIGFVEVVTALHEVERSVAEQLAHGCAAYIAKAANLPSNGDVDPYIKELIGPAEPKVSNKDIELTITHRIVTLVSAATSKLLKRLDVTNISIAVNVSSTVNNGIVFFGKSSVANVMKRYCFLLQAERNPENIHSTFMTAFELCSASNGENSDKVDMQASESTANDKSGMPDLRASASGSQPLQSSQSKNRFGVVDPNWRQGSLEDDRDYCNAGKDYRSGAVSNCTQQRAPPYFPPIGSWVVKRTAGREQEAHRAQDPSMGALYRQPPDSMSLYTAVHDDNLAMTSKANVPLQQTKCTAQRFKSICDELENQPYFFGKITRDQAERSLERDGSFLVRISESKELTAILSVRKDRIAHHIILNDYYGNVTSMDRVFPSIVHLMSHHVRNHIPFTSDDEYPIELYAKYPTRRSDPPLPPPRS